MSFTTRARSFSINPATATKAHRILAETGFIVGMAYQNATAYTLTTEAKRFVQALDIAATELERMQKKVKPRKNSMTFKLLNKVYNIDPERPKIDD
ncbi:MAG: hypothetical protein GYA24_17330 [Candidatus Lokiarchaeota archaeon]|nr:hypothetical protein [Candidatus Lokiarchaeota archaeon]